MSNEFDFITALLPMAPSAAILFFLWRAGLVKFKGENGKEMPDWAKDLTTHFNETTSQLLERIAEGIDKLDDRGEKSCRKLDQIISHHETIKEYGVKLRKK